MGNQKQNNFKIINQMRLILSALLGLAAAIKIKSKGQQWDDDFNYESLYGQYENDMPTGGKTDDYYYSDYGNDDYGSWADYGTDGTWDDDYYGNDDGFWYDDDWYGDDYGDDWSSDDYEGAGYLHEYYEDAGEVAEDAYWEGVHDADECFNYGDCDAVEENHVFTYEYYLEYGDDGDDDYYGDD